MIRALQIKLTAVSMFSLILVLGIILAAINTVNYINTVDEADETLQVLASYNGTFPITGNVFDISSEQDFMSPERARASRYFWVLVSKDGAIQSSDMSEIAAVDSQTAAAYTKAILTSGKDKGFADHYRYLVHPYGDDGLQIIFLDCWRSLSNIQAFALACLWVSLIGLAAVFLLMLFLSKRIARPFAQNYEKQRRFITDAGHEIKTPLTIINADADILEMELGENQWLKDIQNQTRRLTALTNDLIFLSRMEEDSSQLQMIDFPFSDLAEEMVQSFRSMALTQNKHFESQITPMISLRGDEKSLRQLISVLLDNALKYSDEGGTIRVLLERQGKFVVFSVYNTTSVPLEPHLDRLFDRFYRADESRNSKTGGYGIGLSIAAAVVANHKGKISASSADGRSLQVTVKLPS